MLAMLGLVLADNLVALFVFWELTTITSFLLIGYSHENATARRAALQGLLVTGAGALAMLAGFVVLGQAVGTFSLREMLADPGTFADHPRYTAVVVLVLLGAFTKSAQFPFHFWLPNAMAAPTPVSAYLHSATMVKAGVFLLARLTPLLGGTALWMETLSVVGAVTAVYAAFVSLGRSDLKQVLAYTTVMALGTCVLFLGSSPVPGPGEVSRGVLAALAFLVAHALYKAALFLVAGTIEKATGTRDLARLGGCGEPCRSRSRPRSPRPSRWPGCRTRSGSSARSSCTPSASRPTPPPGFRGPPSSPPRPSRPLPWSLRCQPFLGPRPDVRQAGAGRPLGALVRPRRARRGRHLLGAGPGVPVPAPARARGDGRARAGPGYRPRARSLAQHGRGPDADPRSTLAVAGLGFWMRGAVAEALAALGRWIPLSGDRGYDAAMNGIAGVAAWQTRRLQSGVQRHYLLIVFAALGLSLAATLWIKDVVPGPVRWTEATLARVVARRPGRRGVDRDHPLPLPVCSASARSAWWGSARPSSSCSSGRRTSR